MHDVLSRLFEAGQDLVLSAILNCGRLDSTDLKCCQLVCKTWFRIVHYVWHHSHAHRLATRWRLATPSKREIKCLKARAVCTVSSLCIDEKPPKRSLACALGGSGYVELWDRRSLERNWRVNAHSEGVYGVDMNRSLVVTGGDDSLVIVWSRHNGTSLNCLAIHDFIVWGVKLFHNRLVSGSYDCSVAFTDLDDDGNVSVRGRVKGPTAWADALSLDSHGQYLSSYDDETFAISIWTLNSDFISPSLPNEVEQPKVVLTGHTDEVYCVRFWLSSGLVVSGGADATVRLWHLDTGDCLRAFSGLNGKVWSVDMDSSRIVAGCRHGQVWIWHLDDAHDETLGRNIELHSSQTSIGQIKLEPSVLVTADGLGSVVISDFWLKP